MQKTRLQQNDSIKEDFKTIDITPFLLPASILLSAIVLSGGLLMGLNNLSVRLATGVTTNNGSTGTVVPSAGNVPTNPAPTTATVSIDDDPIKGDKSSAKVAIVEFSDYECPFCKKYHTDTFDQIVKNYIDTGKVISVFRDFPLSFHNPLATTQAIAAECVQEFGGDSKYFEYSKLIFKTTNSNGQGMEKSKLYDLAEQIGINRGEFSQCLDDERFKSEVEKDMADGTAAGISGTPGFIIGVLGSDGVIKDGIIVSGAQPFSSFQQVIEDQLNR